MRAIIKDTIHLYLAIVVIPLFITIMLLVGYLLGMGMIYPFSVAMKNVWVGFYYDGQALGFDAWRGQILWLIASFFITLMNRK